MASSSSSPPLKPCQYEVFLSFRGEDTRKNFVDHLLAALDRKGVITFYDDRNIQIGEALPSKLIKAIQESAVAIVVLSENYGSSTWCLNELVEIVECMNKNNLTIYPIFYNVDPSHARKQQESFLKAFSIHEVKYKDEIGMVKSWREALTTVTNLKGVDIRGKYEASWIEKIAKEILWKLPPDSHFTESLVGMESRISAIRILINNNPDEVRFIGFWGMGGVGKTTTATAIFEEFKKKFDGSCFLPNVRQRKNEMVKLQQELISEVLNCEIEVVAKGVKNEEQGRSTIRRRMCGKRVLLVLDDVANRGQLDDLAGECNWFGKGSRIIITTRDEHIINDVQDKYLVDLLNDKEALLLFRAHAFRKEHIEENYKGLSHQVLSYAGGLPLALKVLGRHLRKRGEAFWKDALESLEKVPQEQIISKLQISFDEGLNPLQQNIFLYIACFFRGETRYNVMKYLRAIFHPKAGIEEGIEVLIQKSLIRESRLSIGISRSLLEMHDLLQDMGHHIVRERANSNVQKYSHLWLDEDIKSIFLNYTGSNEAEGIMINCSFYEDAMNVEDAMKLFKEESFMNMNKLRFLQIHYVSGIHNMNKLRFLQIHDVSIIGLIRLIRCIRQPNKFQLPHGLRRLYWINYPAKSLGTHPSIPMDLVHLEMPGSLIKRTPDFSLMPNLEVLDLSCSGNLVHILPSIGHHLKIKRINLASCEKLKEFPTIIMMDSLEYLNLNRTGLGSFPEIYGNVDTLKVLEMISSQIERTPDFSLTPNLEVLDLHHSKKLVYIHPSLEHHVKIKRINLTFCKKLKEFPPIVDMRSLETLDLSYTKLQCFPEITGNVDKLADLNLAETRIRTLPESIGRATGLKRLNLTCAYLDSLPISLQPLRKTVIVDWDKLDSLKREAEDEGEEEAERFSFIKSATEIMMRMVARIFYYCFPQSRESDFLMHRESMISMLDSLKKRTE